MTSTVFASLSHHATKHCRERSIPDHAVDLVLAHADIWCPVGGGATSECISKSIAAELIAEGHAPDDVARAARIAVVVNANGHVITALRPKPGIRGHRYRSMH
ncbi:MAG: hypothetical protein O7B35_02715 [Deltaproteobacteria bacterium]|nr:hypothetical protein [Deltaproteobacteria bacterium]